MTNCSVEGCELLTHAKGLCRRHYARLRLHGRLHKIRGIDKGKCKVDGCESDADSLGLCRLHYQRQYLHGRLYKVNGDKRKHPFYMLWHERKRNKTLCEEWTVNFHAFAEAISPRPEGNSFLVRIDAERPFGPDNFKWEQHLKRTETETNSEWWARKWASRGPVFFRARHLERCFGITPAQYDAMLIAQDGVCAICKNEETSVDKKSQRVRRLAVDHDHKTGKIRELLCSKCNHTIGRINDDVELMQIMIDYLNKHREDKV